ncbi:MAG: hypothetical protein HC892_07895 [Saprospiraceae bacterium]|nr:hypothetical protein [Saprospiraceae bacterium]
MSFLFLEVPQRLRSNSFGYRQKRNLETGQKNKRAAIAWVEENLNTELLNTTPTFGQFSQGFYNKGGKYEQSRILFSRRKTKRKNTNTLMPID